MPIYLGNKQIETLQFNGKAIAEAYYGNTLVYESFKSQVFTFNYTGGQQNWTIPKGCRKLLVNCLGGCGGRSLLTTNVYTSSAGGGLVTCSLSVTPNQSAYIYCGGKGSNTTLTPYTVDIPGGFNGGANGQEDASYMASGVASGGGASDIRLGGNSLNNRVVVAGGGGGAALFVDLSYTGGVGGGLVGGSAQNQGQVVGASGGTQSAGGTHENYGGTDGSLGSGGTLGGGGGYYGGGGGMFSGGGGGSSYTSSSLCTNIYHRQGSQIPNDFPEYDGLVNIITSKGNAIPMYTYMYGTGVTGYNYCPNLIKETGTYSFYTSVTINNKKVFPYMYTKTINRVTIEDNYILAVSSDGEYFQTYLDGSMGIEYWE